MSVGPHAATRLDLGGHVFFLRYEATDVALWEREVGKTFPRTLRMQGNEWGFFEVIKAIQIGIQHHWEGNPSLPALTDQLLNEWIRGYRQGWAHLSSTVINAMAKAVPLDQTAKTNILPPQGVQPPFDSGTQTKTPPTGSTGSSASEKPPESD